jgi:TrmH family RNA methyltransferase
MGNEANGISKELEALIKNKLSIPRFKSKKTESLNGRSNRNCTE